MVPGFHINTTGWLVAHCIRSGWFTNYLTEQFFHYLAPTAPRFTICRMEILLEKAWMKRWRSVRPNIRTYRQWATPSLHFPLWRVDRLPMSITIDQNYGWTNFVESFQYLSEWISRKYLPQIWFVLGMGHSYLNTNHVKSFEYIGWWNLASWSGLEVLLLRHIWFEYRSQVCKKKSKWCTRNLSLL